MPTLKHLLGRIEVLRRPSGSFYFTLGKWAIGLVAAGDGHDNYGLQPCSEPAPLYRCVEHNLRLIEFGMVITSTAKTK